VVGLWEPALERWAPSIKLSKSHYGLHLEVMGPNTLQLNLSGKMIDSLMHAYVAVLQRVRYAQTMNFGGEKSKSSSLEEHTDHTMAVSSKLEFEPATISEEISKFQSQKQFDIMNLTTAPQYFDGDPKVVIRNLLLCEVYYKVLRIQGTLRTETSQVQEGRLAPGESLEYADKGLPQRSVCVTFTLGSFGWCENLLINYDKSKIEFVDFVSGNKSFTMTVETVLLKDTITQQDSSEVDLLLYSQYAFIDKTNINLSVQSRRKGATVCKQTVQKQDMIHHSQKVADISSADRRSHAAGDIITSFRVGSRRQYEMVERLEVGTKVFSDRQFAWQHVPHILLKQAYIRSPCGDFGARARSLLRFTVTRPALVFLLIEASSTGYNKPHPPWIHNLGFKKILLSAVARLNMEKLVKYEEYHFIPYAKYVEGGKDVLLGSPGPIGKNKFMYTVSVVDIGSIDLTEECSKVVLDQIAGHKGQDIGLAQSSWVDGRNGVCMFHGDNDKMKIGDPEASSWSGDLPTVAGQASKGYFELASQDKYGKTAYQLAYTVSTMPGLFSRTRMVKVMPQYSIINCMDESIEIRQMDEGDRITFVEPFNTTVWHKTNIAKDCKLQLRSMSSLWSFGSVNINEIGSSVFVLPPSEWFEETTNQNAVVIHVEVKLAERYENCGIVVVIWRSSREIGSALSVLNNSDMPITVQQSKIFDTDQVRDPAVRESIAKNESMYRICVPPQFWTPFGWADPSKVGEEDGSAAIELTVGAPPFGNGERLAASIGILKLHEITEIEVQLDDDGNIIVPRKSKRRNRKPKATKYSYNAGSTKKAISASLDLDTPRDDVSVVSMNDGSVSPSRYSESGRSSFAGAHSPSKFSVYSSIEEDKETDFVSTEKHFHLFVTVQAWGNGKVLRIAKSRDELGKTLQIGKNSEVSYASAGAAVVAGAVVGTFFLGPIGSMLLAGGE
jgi:antitoxin component of MazEF toxin-antitoxin module